VDVHPLPRDDANRMTHDLAFYLLVAVKSLWPLAVCIAVVILAVCKA